VHGANHTEPVFAEAFRGRANRANDSSLQVIAPPNGVEHFVRFRVEQEGIDGEVAAREVPNTVACGLTEPTASAIVTDVSRILQIAQAGRIP